MRKPDFEDFRKLLDQQAEIFRCAKPSDVLVQAYWQALTDVPLEAVQRCSALHLKRGKFFPKPFELRPKDWTPASGPYAAQSFAADLERLAGVPAREAIGDRELRTKLEAHLAHLTSGPNETAGSRGSFSAAFWRSVETWFEYRLEGKHGEGRWVS